ncbi:hypothetical protein DPMN_089088 [Dreissena polymorpha]|uniref:Uncharacterized protein n=1 Tax=Dreissena polymorpha TaxID=45954 RepID=A0A9D4QX05_DREPO|nr:hypothetical protein DPMN_089088 [Dreissena polymorpha]
MNQLPASGKKYSALLKKNKYIISNLMEHLRAHVQTEQFREHLTCIGLFACIIKKKSFKDKESKR